MSLNDYFRAIAVEHPPVRYAIQAVASGALIPSPYWVTLLQGVNLIIGTLTGVGAFVLTWAAVYRLVKHYRTDK